MKNSPTMGGPVVPNSVSVFKRQTLSRAAALLPLALLLPLMLIGINPKPPLADHDLSERSEQGEAIRLLRGDIQKATSRAVYWQAAARRSGGKDAHAAFRARQFGRNAAWLNNRMATRYPWAIGDPCFLHRIPRDCGGRFKPVSRPEGEL